MKHINTTDMYFQVINCEEIDELKQILNRIQSILFVIGEITLTMLC